VAAAIGGRRVPGSGASPYARGDAKNERYLVEAKQTAKDSIRVTWGWLAKITRQALGAGRVPALAIEVRCGAPRDPLVPTEWVCVPLGEWQRLLELER
jgi:Holliday junction resolvase